MPKPYKHAQNDEPKRWPVKAYNNADFLNSPDARYLRVLSEFMEPHARFRRYGVNSTISFYGSARILPRSVAEERLEAARRVCADNPGEATHAAQSQAEQALVMSRYYEDAVELATRLTKWSLAIPKTSKRFHICSGGGPGIMEAANRGAHLAGGQSIGLNISLPFEQEPNAYQTHDLSLEFHYFFVRKFWFVYLAKALVVFPGGFGTFDELFNLLTLVQTRKTSKQGPILLYGKDFWNEVIHFEALVRWGLISPEDLGLFTIVDDVGTAFDLLTSRLTEQYLK
jgi:uncharacterized protein (TIGR00730 family)